MLCIYMYETHGSEYNAFNTTTKNMGEWLFLISCELKYSHNTYIHKIESINAMVLNETSKKQTHQEAFGSMRLNMCAVDYIRSLIILELINFHTFITKVSEI